MQSWHGQTSCSPGTESVSDRFRSWVSHYVACGGPAPANWTSFQAEIAEWHKAMVGGGLNRQEVALTLDSHPEQFGPATVQGFGRVKPHGYAGDFEMMERIYLGWRTSSPALANWDDFFHAQSAVKAVRNRKAYFKALLDELPPGATVLELGVGPGRGMFEWMRENRGRRVSIECVDADAGAILHARRLNQDFLDRIVFHQANVLRFRPNPGANYDLIWAAGLFDYFDDDLFRRLGSRFYRSVKPGGKLVIGNFADSNPSKPYMELLGDWYLHHRAMQDLLGLGRAIGGDVAVDSEPEGVNLFLHVRAGVAPPTLP